MDKLNTLLKQRSERLERVKKLYHQIREYLAVLGDQVVCREDQERFTLNFKEVTVQLTPTNEEYTTVSVRALGVVGDPDFDPTFQFLESGGGWCTESHTPLTSETLEDLLLELLYQSDEDLRK